MQLIKTEPGVTASAIRRCVVLLSEILGNSALQQGQAPAVFLFHREAESVPFRDSYRHIVICRLVGNSEEREQVMRGNLYYVFCWIRAHAFGASISAFGQGM